MCPFRLLKGQSIFPFVISHFFCVCCLDYYLFSSEVGRLGREGKGRDGKEGGNEVQNRVIM